MHLLLMGHEQKSNCYHYMWSVTWKLGSHQGAACSKLCSKSYDSITTTTNLVFFTGSYMMICFLLFSTSAVQQNFIVKHGRHSIVTWQFVRIWFTRTMVKIDVGIAKGEKKSTLTLEYLITLRHLSNVHSVHIGKLSFIWLTKKDNLMLLN